MGALAKVTHYHETFTGWRACRDSSCGSGVWDRWLCTKRTKVRNQPRYEVCGEAYFYKRKRQGVVGGPTDRQLDRRYAYGYQYRCKHDGLGLLRHESAPDPDQPVQDPALFDQIEHLKVVAKEARKKRGRKKGSTA